MLSEAGGVEEELLAAFMWAEVFLSVVLWNVGL